MLDFFPEPLGCATYTGDENDKIIVSVTNCLTYFKVKSNIKVHYKHDLVEKISVKFVLLLCFLRKYFMVTLANSCPDQFLS